MFYAWILSACTFSVINKNMMAGWPTRDAVSHTLRAISTILRPIVGSLASLTVQILEYGILQVNISVGHLRHISGQLL